MAAAVEMGLSYGKYLAFLEIQSRYPDITPQEVQGMTMREIRDLLDSLLPDGEQDICPGQNGGHGGGHGKRRRGSDE